MTLLLRATAVAIAVLALIDPARASRRPVPLPVEVLLPAESDPGHAAALDRLREIERTQSSRMSTTSSEAPRARLYLGGPLGPVDVSVPLFVLRPEPAVGITISRVSSAGLAASGQAVSVEAVMRADGLSGRTSTITVSDRGVVVARTDQSWTKDGEERVVRLEYAAPSTGTLPLELRVDTPGADPVSADIAAVVVPQALRVLIFEPRPSWAVAFIRRALEGRPEFAVAALSRSAPRVATRLNAAPATLDALTPGDFDVLVVGAPEQLRTSDLRVLDRFASERGGAVLLVPDTRLPAGIQGALGLPPMDERLLETPANIQAGPTTLQASELLIAPGISTADSIATVPLDGVQRPVLIATPRGEGTIVVSGMLDAWRYRSAAGERFWRGLVADLAVASPAPLTLDVEPRLARTGDRIRVTARWRRDQITRADGPRVPSIAASIADPDDTQEPLRLWPGERAGVYEGWTVAGTPGTYRIAAEGPRGSAAALLRVDGDVVHATRVSAAADAAAQRSGGGVVRSVAELQQQLEGMPVVEIDGSTHPMRSPWWIVPFAGCLGIEWLIRRKRGMR